MRLTSGTPGTMESPQRRSPRLERVREERTRKGQEETVWEILKPKRVGVAKKKPGRKPGHKAARTQNKAAEEPPSPKKSEKKGPGKRVSPKKTTEPAGTETRQNDLLAKLRAEFEALGNSSSLAESKLAATQRALDLHKEHNAELEAEMYLMTQERAEAKFHVASMSNDKRKLEEDLRHMKTQSYVYLIALIVAFKSAPRLSDTMNFQRLIDVTRNRVETRGWSPRNSVAARREA